MPYIQTLSTPQEEPKPRNGALYSLIAIFVSVWLSIGGTWLLVYYFPIPDDDAIYVGLIIGLLVVSFVLFLTFWQAGPLVRQGKSGEALLTSAILIPIGLLAASVLGSLPWLWSQLVEVQPWVAELWFLWPTLYLLWMSWLARRSRANQPK